MTMNNIHQHGPVAAAAASNSSSKKRKSAKDLE
jgi:hypothetical protein